jgi:hypothetical protein
MLHLMLQQSVQHKAQQSLSMLRFCCSMGLQQNHRNRQKFGAKGDRRLGRRPLG